MLPQFRQWVSDRVRTYLRDCYDHTIQLAGISLCCGWFSLLSEYCSADILESYRELANGLLNTYLSALSQKTNEIMKLLTLVGTHSASNAIAACSLQTLVLLEQVPFSFR